MEQPTHRELEELKAFALSLPGAHEDFPWGHSVIKVKKKIFVVLGQNDQSQATVALKLPVSSGRALASKACEPTGYGLGKSDWVTVCVGRKDSPAAETLLGWVEESYRAIAPKTLLKQHDGEAKAPAMPKAVAKRRRPNDGLR